MLTSCRSSRGYLMSVDTQAATARLMRFLAIEGVTGKEAAIGRELASALGEAGVPADAIRLDDANTRIPVPTETGNLIVDLPGRGSMHNQPRIMFMTHMDTVPLCAGATPKLAGRRIVNAAKTAPGGDSRCGCGMSTTAPVPSQSARDDAVSCLAGYRGLSRSSRDVALTAVDASRAPA